MPTGVITGTKKTVTYQMLVTGLLLIARCTTDIQQRQRDFSRVVFCLEFTTGGNGHGARCHFPFIYRGTAYSSCIYGISLTCGAPQPTTTSPTRSGLTVELMKVSCLGYLVGFVSSTCSQT